HFRRANRLRRALRFPSRFRHRSSLLRHNPSSSLYFPVPLFSANSVLSVSSVLPSFFSSSSLLLLFFFSPSSLLLLSCFSPSSLLLLSFFSPDFQPLASNFCLSLPVPPHHRLHRPSRIPHPCRPSAAKLKLQKSFRRLFQLTPIPVPPRLLHFFQPIHVHVLHIHHLQQSRFPVRASPPAQPAPAMRRLGNR